MSKACEEGLHITEGGGHSCIDCGKDMNTPQKGTSDDSTANNWLDELLANVTEDASQYSTPYERRQAVRRIISVEQAKAIIEAKLRETRIDELKGMLYHLQITGDWNPTTVKDRIAALQNQGSK